MRIQIRLIDVCAPDFLTDHHNRDGEALISVPVTPETLTREVISGLVSGLFSLASERDDAPPYHRPNGGEPFASFSDALDGFRETLAAPDSVFVPQWAADPSLTVAGGPDDIAAHFLITWDATRPAIAPIHKGAWKSARGRLARYRAEGVNWRERRGYETSGPAYLIKTARQARAWQRPDSMRPRASKSEQAYYVDSWDVLAWRDKGTSQEVFRAEGAYRSADHSGYYCDAFASETVSGRVLQLPARGGVPQYVPGVEWSNASGVTVYPLDRHDSAIDAARAADGYAERLAEAERAYSHAWQAGTAYGEKRDALASARQERRRLQSAMRETWRAARAAGVAVPAVICETLARDLAALKSSAAALYREAERLKDGEGFDGEAFGYFYTGDSDLRAAFNEGAGRDVL